MVLDAEHVAVLAELMEQDQRVHVAEDGFVGRLEGVEEQLVSARLVADLRGRGVFR